MAEFLQLCLQQYIDNNCKPPELGEPLKLPQDEEGGSNTLEKASMSTDSTPEQVASATDTNKYAEKGNIVIHRVLEEQAPLGEPLTLLNEEEAFRAGISKNIPEKDVRTSLAVGVSR
jgi:hypothetical protein